MENIKTDKENDGIWIGDKQHGIQMTNDGIYFWENGESFTLEQMIDKFQNN